MNTGIDLPQVNIPDNVIHLGLGQPGKALLPVRDLAKAAGQAMKGDDAYYLAYGEEQGNEQFRSVLARFLTRRYPEPVAPEQLLITNGNSQALDFICARFTRPGDTVLIEEPSYFLALKIFRDHHLNLVSVPVDDQGLCTDRLREVLKSVTPAFIYTIPTHHNPAGVTLSEKRRTELAAICRTFQVLLVADEVYHFLTFSKQLPTPMGRFVSEAPIISLGSFSKILAPGLRLGWIHTSKVQVTELVRAGVLVSGGGLNPFVSQIVGTYMAQECLGPHIDRLNRIYTQRCAALAAEIRTRLPAAVRFEYPGGGYFIWLRLPDEVNAGKLRKAAVESGVDFFPGELFSSRQRLANYIRLAFCYYDEPMLAKGVQRLARVIGRW